MKFFDGKEEAIKLIDENLKGVDYDFDSNVNEIVRNVSWDNVLSKIIG